MGKAVPGFSLNSFISPAASAGEWYRSINYEDAKNIIREKMVSSAENFVAIGYYLSHISEKKQYLEGGYENIWECSEKEFGFSKGRTSRCINICKAYSVGGDSPFLDERFKGFNTSQLQEMLSIKDERLIEQLTPDMSVKKIREAKATNGVKAIDDMPLDGQMQIATIEGDFRTFEPVNESDLAVNPDPLPLQGVSDEDDSDVLEEKRESASKEPTDVDIQAFYKSCIKGQYDCNRDDLKNKLRENMGKTYYYYGDSDRISYQCTPRGVSINSSQEITWTKLVKRINELIPVVDEQKKAASVKPEKTVQNTEERIGKDKSSLPNSNVVIINFSGCYGKFCRELTEREIEIFKKGVLAERERIWDKLADTLDEDDKKCILQLKE